MSSKLLGHVWDLNLPDHATKLVLLRLADSANDETGECWPSLKHIQDKCNIKSKNTIRRALEVLEQLGLVVVIKRKLSSSQNTSNLYRLNIKKILNPGNKFGSSNSELGGGSNSEPRGSNSELGGGSNSEPRTNNSFEPINEFNNPLPPKGESAHADEHVSEKIKKSAKPKLEYQAIVDLFNRENEETGSRLSEVIAINEKRKRDIKKFLKELKEPTLECAENYFSVFFDELKPFHLGENNRSWKATFDYAIRPDTVLKVREGNL